MGEGEAEALAGGGVCEAVSDLLNEYPCEVDGVGVGVCDGDAPMMVSESELLVTAEPGAFDSTATRVLVPDCALVGTVSDATPFALPDDEENVTVVEAILAAPEESVRTSGDESAVALHETARIFPAVTEDGAERVKEGAAHEAEYVQNDNQQKNPDAVEPGQVESATVQVPAVHAAVQRQLFVVTLAVAVAVSDASTRSDTILKGILLKVNDWGKERRRGCGSWLQLKVELSLL
jgi:hypothetical protein